MLTRLGTLVILTLALAALLAAPVSAGASGTTAAEASLLREINRVRGAHGLRTLRLDGRLARAARAHSRSMAARGTFAHGAFAARMVRFKVRGPFVGENLAWGTGARGTARGIVRAWLNSPGHRRNLLRPGFRRIGIGDVRAAFNGISGARIVTADFAGY